MDTDVLVAGLSSRNGASYQISTQIPKGKINYILSVPLFLEYVDVLKRPKLLNQIKLTAKEIDIILQILAAHGEAINIHYLWRPYLKDPNDDMVLELAVNGAADAIVTFNLKDFTTVENHFAIKVLTPGQYYHLNLKGVA